jgi:hypothetical protein
MVSYCRNTILIARNMRPVASERTLRNAGRDSAAGNVGRGCGGGANHGACRLMLWLLMNNSAAVLMIS